MKPSSILKKQFFLTVGVILALTSAASAANIASVTGAAAVHWSIGGPFEGGQLLDATWTDATAYSNVSVAVEIGASTPESIDAYLTTAIGPTATAANVVASVTGFVPTSAKELDTLFSGLKLGTGTYYLVIAGTSVYGAHWWGTGVATPATTGPGVTFGGDGSGYLNSPSPAPIPAAAALTSTPTLGLLFQVTGTPTPEPSSAALLVSALLVLAAAKAALTSSKP